MAFVAYTVFTKLCALCRIHSMSTHILYESESDRMRACHAPMRMCVDLELDRLPGIKCIVYVIIYCILNLLSAPSGKRLYALATWCPSVICV